MVNDIILKSENNVDYSKLQKLLAQQQWKEADYETYVCMIQAAGSKKGDYFDLKDIENFPYQDLLTLDQLWLNYSNGRFGFSVQKQIWLEVGGQINYETEKKLGDRIGWRKEGEWISYNSLPFDLSAPKGQLPMWGGWACSVGLGVSLLQRLATYLENIEQNLSI